MYEQILRQIQQAVKSRRVRFTAHALNELSLESLSPSDSINCILTGEIVEDQFDPDYEQIKYVIFGNTLTNDEMGIVARWDDFQRVIVITAYRLRITDYD